MWIEASFDTCNISLDLIRTFSSAKFELTATAQAEAKAAAELKAKQEAEAKAALRFERVCGLSRDGGLGFKPILGYL